MADLKRLLYPNSIAFIGGAQMAGPIRVCKRGRYEGKLMPVNPSRSEIEGIDCIPSLADLPVSPDAAVVGLSPDRAIEAVAALSAMGAGGAVVMSSGFAELNEEGKARQKALKEALEARAEAKRA